MTGAERIVSALAGAGAEKAQKSAVRLRLCTVVSELPLQITVGGVVIGPSGLLIDERLLRGSRRAAELASPAGVLSASVDCSQGAVSSISVSGGNLGGKLQWTEAGFRVGDRLLALTDDDQIFYVIAKVVACE